MIKRIFDIFLSSLAILVVIPFFLIIAIAIIFDSKGGVFYLQERVGYKLKKFKIIKFRTMYISEEKNKNLLTIKNDSRITKVGSFLRRFKIDEFPQLVNVLKGDMSFVGPRPEVSKYVNFYPQKSIELIFKVKPGITDMASIKFRNESQMLLDSNDPESYYKNYILPEKIKYYEKYAESNSIFLDILIILKTLLKIFK